MKIYCTCGNTIYDQTDAISYKASFVADQDYEDLCDAIERHIQTLAATLRSKPVKAPAAETAVGRVMMDVRQALRTYARRTMYQCSACGRLYVDDRSSASQIFVPADADVPKNLLRSVHGDAWKRPLRGRWNDGEDAPTKGELWWGFGDTEEGYERFDDWDTLQRRYLDVFARLRGRDILRDALLQRGGEILHQWP
jgi:hypothetical protein